MKELFNSSGRVDVNLYKNRIYFIIILGGVMPILYTAFSELKTSPQSGTTMHRIVFCTSSLTLEENIWFAWDFKD